MFSPRNVALLVKLFKKFKFFFQVFFFSFFFFARPISLYSIHATITSRTPSDGRNNQPFQKTCAAPHLPSDFSLSSVSQLYSSGPKHITIRWLCWMLLEKKSDLAWGIWNNSAIWDHWECPFKSLLFGWKKRKKKKTSTTQTWTFKGTG